MRCLNDGQIQEVVDREADEALQRHVRACGRCAERVRAREALMSSVRDSIAATPGMPGDLRRRVEHALSAGSTQGATRLRDVRASRTRHRAFWSAVAVAAATLVAVFFIAPMLKGPATVSAAEILAASANRLAQPDATGVELLEYELTLEGVPSSLMPDHANGSYRVKQTIDHAHPGRYRLATYSPDGRLISAIAQDPAAQRRVMAIRVDDRPYRFDFTVREGASLSIPEMERLHMQASVAMMQASGNQHLQVLETPAGRLYRIDVPHVTAGTPGLVWDLTAAHVVIAADDYRIVEFAVKGAFLKQPYSVSYKLIDRDVKTPAELLPEDFDVPDEPGAIVFSGEGTAIPAGDALLVALRELAKMKAR